ncbi:hypothetical protein KIW84_020120 [Lathyrus oleraceus]|uniref:Uncharacterized protein n=1 Tax=Pisum sativum TaxID=3888 RepID=A0A9D4Y8T4_PEA|nr:hypothetical protein KIW84_020120 [Pisum sativum]
MLSFTDMPNVGNNPLHRHGGPGVNVVEIFTDESLIKDVFEVKAPLAVVYAKLDEADLIKGVHDQYKSKGTTIINGAHRTFIVIQTKRGALLLPPQLRRVIEMKRQILKDNFEMMERQRPMDNFEMMDK